MLQRPLSDRRAKLQFSLASLFELTAICALLAACWPMIGAMAAGILMLLPVALAMGNGFIALSICLIACASTELVFEGQVVSVLGRQGLDVLLTIAICAWVQRRVRPPQHKRNRHRREVFPLEPLLADSAETSSQRQE